MRARAQIAELVRNPHAVSQWRLRKRIRKLRQDAKVSLNLGCGSDPIPGMVNCDMYSDHADLRMDVIRLAVAENSIDFIETHHVIEHLSFLESAKALDEWACAIKPGGHLLITCPNLSRVARKWRVSSDSKRWSDVITMIYGSQEHPGMFHKSGYTPRRLRAMVAERGFDVEAYDPFPRHHTPSFAILGVKRSPAA